jgi:hypothetical protein
LQRERRTLGGRGGNKSASGHRGNAPRWRRLGHAAQHCIRYPSAGTQPDDARGIAGYPLAL